MITEVDNSLEVQITACEREPIHIPGSIQPHGVLLVVDRQNQHNVRQFAGDTLLILGVEPSRIVGLPLQDLFDDRQLQPIVKQLEAATAKVAPFILLNLTPRESIVPVHATVHIQKNIGIIELEPIHNNDSKIENYELSRLKQMLAALLSTEDLQQDIHVAASQIRAATGFDRVMVYQFLHDGSGKVVAEDKAAGLDSFLDLHYPASDIPKQARELYRRNWIRLIPDIDYIPKPITPSPDHDALPLDMSDCVLRSVSPLHLEYLRNMGVAASMSISIVLEDKLWGLIACHHHTPRFIAPDVRATCELFAQLFSLHVQAKIRGQQTERRLSAQQAYARLAIQIALTDDLPKNLIGKKFNLLDLIRGGGAAVFARGTISTIGDTPPITFLNELESWLKERNESVLSTNQLGAILPAAIPFASNASGLLAVMLPSQSNEYILWFRPELAHTVRWAGNPHKEIEVSGKEERLAPRKSFEAWLQEVRHQSEPWDDVDIDVASSFRIGLLETVLQQSALARQANEAALAQQSLLIAELDHRVKNILANIQALVGQTKMGAESLKTFTHSLESRIQAMALAHNLMSKSRWKGASVYELVKAELSPYESLKVSNTHIQGEEIFLSPTAALPFILVIHELSTNAAKYGALSTPAGKVIVEWCTHKENGDLVFHWTEQNGPTVAPRQKRGFGSAVIENSLRHELKGQSTLTFAPEGVSCAIRIPQKYTVTLSAEDRNHV